MFLPPLRAPAISRLRDQLTWSRSWGGFARLQLLAPFSNSLSVLAETNDPSSADELENGASDSGSLQISNLEWGLR
jgi:hypothetical protein